MFGICCVSVSHTEALKKTVLLFVFSGADAHKENFEPLFFTEEDEERRDEDYEDEGYIPGTTPLNMATNNQVQKNRNIFYSFRSFGLTEPSLE